MSDLYIWHGSCRLYWRTDAFGHEGFALFVGGLHVGSIMYWKNNEKRKDTPYRAWIMRNDDDGQEVGWYATEQAAKDALVDAAILEIEK